MPCPGCLSFYFSDSCHRFDHYYAFVLSLFPLYLSCVVPILCYPLSLLLYLLPYLFCGSYGFSCISIPFCVVNGAQLPSPPSSAQCDCLGSLAHSRSLESYCEIANKIFPSSILSKFSPPRWSSFIALNLLLWPLAFPSFRSLQTLLRLHLVHTERHPSYYSRFPPLQIPTRRLRGQQCI